MRWVNSRYRALRICLRGEIARLTKRLRSENCLFDFVGQTFLSVRGEMAGMRAGKNACPAWNSRREEGHGREDCSGRFAARRAGQERGAAAAAGGQIYGGGVPRRRWEADAIFGQV